MTAEYTFFGHGTHMIKTSGQRLLVDPFFEGNPSAPIGPNEVDCEFIFVSHGHGDHVGDTLEIATRTGALVVSNFEIAGWLSEQGVKTHAQHIGGGHHHPFGYLKLTQAFHGSGLPDGSYGGGPAGMLLTTRENEKIYLACDTALFGDMRLYGDEGLDLAVIPIGDNFTMGPEDALKAVKLLRPKKVVPCHYNTWPLIEQDAAAWAARVAAETESEPVVLLPGESIQV